MHHIPQYGLSHLIAAHSFQHEMWFAFAAFLSLGFLSGQPPPATPAVCFLFIVSSEIQLNLNQVGFQIL
jgi:hypothetical protein